MLNLSSMETKFTIEKGPCKVMWDWVEPGIAVNCAIIYEEPGTVGYRLIGDGWAILSETDRLAGRANDNKGMQVAMRKAMASAADAVLSSHEFRRRLWFEFRDRIGWPKKKYKPTQKETKLPKDIIGHTFFYKGENYTVVNIVWGKAPRAVNRDTKGYWKKGETPGTRKWVEYVEYEPHRGAEQRFVRPKAEFLSKFGICELKENVRVIEDFPEVDPTPNASAFDNFE